jgi:YtkA-like
MRGLALPAAIFILGCSNDGPGNPAETEDDAALCGGRGDPVYAGLVKSSSGGYSFEVLELEPEPPIISQAEPGNTWTLAVADAAGEALSGASMTVSTFMSDHNHAGPSSVGIEQEPGVYLIEDLLLPMPALYAITVKVRPAGASEDEDVSYSICVSAQSG